LASASREVPVYTFDEHNEAFYYWHVARRRGFLDGPLDLVHVDAHDDMGLADKYERSLYCPDGTDEADYLAYYRAFADEQLDIASFIVPAVLGGVVRNVYFVYPAWRTMKPARRRLNVCSAFGEGKVIKHGLDLRGEVDRRVNLAYPDLRRFTYHVLPLEKLPQRRRVVLDIDLDFFACRDTVRNLYSYELEISAEQFAAREQFLADASLRWAGLEFAFAEKDGRYVAQVAHKKVPESVHLPADEEIREEVGKLVDTLALKGIRPAAVTVCRSCFSGYCPGEYVQAVEAEVLRGLERLLAREQA
jgi:hypothetical protein